MRDLPRTLIKVDQVGYETSSHKLAYLAVAGGPVPDRFELRREKDRKVVYSGHWSAPAFDPDSGDSVQIADFSAWDETGDYFIDVPANGRSWPFRIAPDVYRRTYYLAARSFYGQRCGSAVDLGPEFPGYRHGFCHAVGAFDPSSGKQGAAISKKGWHDAGDYGRYIVNSSIATATLLWTHELWGKNSMRQVSLQLPESGNGTPDLLSETRWNLDWMMTMQDSDGGVWHKQTSAHFCGFIPPDKDNLPSLVIGAGHAPFKTSCATADFAAVMAIAARVLAEYDRAYAGLCLASARKAWRWLKANEQVVFRNPPGVSTGEYGDSDCSDEELWAAAELARTTREAEFETYFGGHYSSFLSRIAADNPPGNTQMGAFALWTYVLGKGLNKVAIEAIETQSINMANVIVERAASQAYRTTMVRRNYVWGSNGVAANYGLQLLIANQFRPDRRYVETAMGNLHYMLGCNPFSLSYVAQVGSQSVRHLHHRPSASSGLAAPWPGLLSGGPNANRQDEEMQRLIPVNTPPARSFLDVQGSYASNEVSINWNAALVFLLAGVLPR